MKRIVSSVLFALCLSTIVQAQTSDEFWLAPPDITWRHNASYGDDPIFLNLTSTGPAATVTIDQPANPAWTPIIVNLAANTAVRYDMSAFKSDLETIANDMVQNTGLHITSTAPITAYYENANPNNPDFMALKGANGLGEEFYIPLHKHAPFYNHDYSGNATDWAYASFDIVATEDNTTVLIYSPVDVLGHPALTPFTVMLNAGQTYSCANMDAADHNDPTHHPSGAVVLADKAVAVSIKDDSNHNPSGGCYDLMTDQIVPVEIVGTDYIAVKGQLNNNGDESLFIMATQNNTEVFVDGSPTPVTTLFAGQYYRHDMDYLASAADNATYVTTTKPSYAIHVTGFGCEQGQAILPPLNCAGSRQLSFTRATNEAFYLNLLVRNGSQNDFTLTGPGTATINGGDFQVVPGTGGEWMATQIEYNTTEVPVNQAFIVSNSSDVFSLAIINGGASTGCRYGFFSEFAGEIIVDAGTDQNLCEGDDVVLAGSVNGGSTTGIWTSTGSGVFIPNDTDMNATYQPSLGDYALGSVTINLESTGDCDPVSDEMEVTFQPLPIVDAADDFDVCSNNPTFSLNGSVLNAAGGVWSGGAGTFLPSTSSMTATYTPTPAEIASGSLTLTLTSTGNGNCPAVQDDLIVTFTASPTANAGSDETVCANNPAVDLSGGFTVATGGIWSGGAGTFDPSTTNMNAQYTPTAAEIASGSVTLTLTTTGNGNCNSVTDQMTINFTDAPTANAGSDVTVCENNADVSLGGAITIASGGTWSGGLGTFNPDNSTLNSTYTPSAAEIAAGSVTLTLTTTGNGDCLAASDDIVISFTPAPTVDAGADGTTCANNANISLAGVVTVATGGVWSGGSGSFSPNNTNLNATYTPSAAEIAAGTVTLTLTSAGNGLCNAVTDQVTYTITDAPTASAGADQTLCANNADVVLAGSVTIASGGQWSGGSGTFNPSNTALNATYTPTATELSNGSVTLTLTTTGNGTCLAASDEMTVTFTDAPTADAGSDITVCENNALVSLSGIVTTASGGVWSGGLGTFSPNNSALNATYTPSATEIAAGSLTLTLTTTGNGDCVPVSDDMVINFTAAPTVDAGADGSTCANNATISLAGSVTVATGGVWSGGSGSFSPNNTNLNATYTPSAADIAAGTVTLTLTSAGNGLCNAVSDQVTFTITDAPAANAGADQTLCDNNATVTLAGTVTVASGGQWSGGSGTFSPSNTALNASYTPTVTELANGSVTLTLTTTGNGNCVAVSDAMTVTFTDGPTVFAGSNQTACANNPDVTLAGSVTIASGGAWSGGLGTFSPNNTTLNATYTPTATELAAGTVTLTLTSTGNGNCNAVTDDMTINYSPAPTVNAGPDGSVCSNNADISLSGSITVAAGGVWSGGAGSFLPNNTALNATYQPTAAEIASGSVTLTLTTSGNGLCLAETDQVTYTFTDSPTSNAGVDQTQCANNAQTILNGSITNASGGVWTGGAGSFNPSNTDVNATYTPSPAEISAGSVTLTLTTTGNGTCNAVSDAMTISFTPAPTANAGPDQTKCQNNADISLSGTFSVATGAQWSGGLGTFSPSSTAMNATYSPTLSEIASGSITLTLTTTGNGSCNSVSDDVQITFTAAPVVDAGTDIDVCANAADASLNGSVSIATGGVWSGGAGTFSPNNTSLSATYTPSASEIAAGSVTLTLTSAGNGTCLPETDEVVINIAPAPVVNAGATITTCANNPNASLSGSVVNATGGVWSGGGGSFNPSNTDLSATYTPSAAEIAAGSVTLTLTSTGNGNCLAVDDVVLISITDSPTVSAGADQTICSNNPDVSLSASVTNASGGIWSGGLGVFSPSITDPNATYSPTATEIASGVLTLTYTSTDNGTCNAVSDDMTIVFTASPSVDAGADETICENNLNLTLNGSVSIATGAVWSGGTGTFLPNNTSLNATYTPSAAEIALGTVTLTLTTSGNGNCNSESDEMVVTILPAPEADAGGDVLACSNNAEAQLGGSVNGAGGGQWSGGAGTFVPAITALNAIYYPTPAEVASGSLTLTLTTIGNGDCDAVSDDVVITFTASPTADAGLDDTYCENNADISLNGSVTVATGGEWSGGGGTFTPSNTDLNATYTPSAGELAFGSVTLTLTTTSNGNCNSVSDDVTFTFTDAPVVDAGADLSSCANNAAVNLNGSVTIATGGLWSGGAGNYSPNNSTLNATYTPTAAEIAAGSVTLTLTSFGNGLCNPESDQVTINIGPSPIADAGTDINVAANNPDATLNGSVTNATGGSWSGGTGSYNPDANSLGATYTPSAAEIIAGSVTLTLSTTGNGNCNTETDEVTIFIGGAPTADANADQTVCANNADVQLNGAVTIATGGQWSGGLGTFTPNNNTLNAVYTPTVGEISAGSVTLTLTTTGNGFANPESDDMTITFGPAPTSDAGSDVTICENNSTVSLNGSVTLATGGVWSAGGGAFSPNATSLLTDYTPTAAEVTAGTFKIYLTTTGNGTCNAVTDSLTVSVIPAPVVNAGADLSSCSNDAIVTLGANVIGASGLTWSGGGGVFTPDANTANATYEPTATEIAAGAVTLTATSTGNGLCNAVSDDVLITIFDEPIVNAGVDQTLCSNNSQANLNGSVLGAGGGQWSGGAGGFFPSSATLTAVYSPTQTELDAGSLWLYLTSTDNGNCVSVTDSLLLTFTPSPTADAGADDNICSNAASVALSGTVTVATGGIWTGGAGSFSPSPNNLNVDYSPTADEVADGGVTLYLTTTGSGNCIEVSDSVQISITPMPIVNSGPDQSICKNNTTIFLGGFVGNATGGVWSGGSGSFVPSNTSMTPQYIPTAAEIASGSLTLTLSSTGNVICPTVTDDMVITFTDAPVVDAGVDLSVCQNNSDVQLNGNVTNATGAQWSGGAGTFTPSATVFNPIYQPTSAELAAGSVTLTLTSTDNGNCIAVADQITVTFTPSPIVNAGADMDVCDNNPTINLNGSVAVASGGEWSGGLGTFSPNAQTLNASYTPTAFELQSGSITLTLTSTGNGNCLAETDDVVISVLNEPTVDAGVDLTVCVDNLNIPLSGSVTGVTNTGEWSSTGTGTFFPSNTALNGTYIASSQDSINGFVALTLISTSNGLCNAVSDITTVTLLPTADADAGTDIIVCADNPTIELDGDIIGNATQGTWTTTGSGTFNPDNTTLDAEYIPSAADIATGSVTFTLTINSCDADTDEMTATITTVPVVSAGPDVVTCVDDLDINLNGAVSGSSSTGSWETTGSGTFLNGPDALANVYQASTADSLAQAVTLILHATNIGSCQAVSDTIEISILPAADVSAGADMSFCANNVSAQLNGTLIGDPQSIVWTTSGSGTFSPSADVLNPIYIPSATDTIIGGVTLTLAANNSCNSAIDAMFLELTPAPYVNAGDDQVYCESAISFNLDGVVSGITTQGVWTTTGTGTIADPTSLNTTYTASAADIAAGQIDFFLTSISNGNCNQVIDDMSIFLSDGITADAGVDQQVCILSGLAQLNPSITNGSPEGLWTTSGTGVFVPDNTTLNAEYQFSNDDVSAGSVTLTLSTTNNGSCTPSTDSMVLTFGSSSFADAGANQSVCANDPIAQLSGTVSGGALGGVWSASGSGFFDNNTSMTPTYTLSADDIANGGVDITLTTVTDGTCTPITDVMTISVDEVPAVNAGSDVVVCTAGQIQLNASLSNAASVLWTTDGTGSFFDDGLPNTLYYPSQSDSIIGSVTLTVETVGSGECASVNDQMVITFGGGLSANAGADVSLCSDNPNVTLNGVVSGTTSGQWTTNGTGFFEPAANDLSATYVPGAADYVIGDIWLILTTTNNLGCTPGVDSMLVSYNIPPTADAGSNILVCDEIAPIQLAGAVANESAVEWTTAGSGSFDQSDIIDPIYTPSQADSLLGNIMLYLTASPLGACTGVIDSVRITFAPLRVADAGADVFTCADGNDILMNGSFIGSGGGVWSTNGTGTFSPAANDPQASYTPSATDLVFDQLEFVFMTTGNSGCPAATDTMVVTFEPLSQANAGEDQTTCDAIQEIQLNGSYLNATGAFWTTTGAGTFVPDEFDMNAIYQPAASDEDLGIITFTLETTGISNCAVDQDEMLLAFVNPLTLDFSIENNCSGQEVTFTDQSLISSGEVIAWNWDFGNGSQGGGAIATTTYDTPGQYNVTLEVFALNGCSATITETIDVLEAPIAGFSYTGVLLEYEVISIIDGSFGATDYLYDFDDGTGSQESDPQHIFTDAGQYEVTQTVSNSSGCTDEATVLLSILSEEILAPKLPNAFTPNGDGENDVFLVRGGPFATMHLEIYNGWGELIFVSDDPLFGWDGTVDGKPEQTGTYVYTAVATTVDGREFIKSGKVALIR